MSPVEAARINTHPLKVADLAVRFDRSAYTIRGWAKAGKLKGAKKIGRSWCFTLDVEYVDAPEAPVAPAVPEQVQRALDRLDQYQVGGARAAA